MPRLRADLPRPRRSASSGPPSVRRRPSRGSWTWASIGSCTPIRRRSPRTHDVASPGAPAALVSRVFPITLALLGLGFGLLGTPAYAASPSESAGIHAKSAEQQFQAGNWE